MNEQDELWQLLHKGITDAVEWVKAAPTEEARLSRISVVHDALTGKQKGNEEFDVYYKEDKETPQ